VIELHYMKIIPIASGKGGVGKSVIAANLAVLLAKTGKKVILVDMDLGGSNLHLLLGLRRIDKGVGSYLVDSGLNLQDLIIDTEYAGLHFIPGDSGVPGLANIGYSQKRKLINELLRLKADYLVLDLGAGTTFNTLDFFLISGRGIIVTMPTSASVLTSYLFLKNIIFRIIASVFPQGSSGYKLMEKVKKDNRNLQHIDMNKLKAELERADPEHYKDFLALMTAFRPALVMNMLNEPADAVRAERLRASVRQYLGIELDFPGVVFRDDTQNKALEAGLPVVLYKPHGVLTRALQRIAKRIEESDDDSDSILLRAGKPDETFKIAIEEAEEDYRLKAESIADLYINESLKEGDVIETLRVQQYELNQLRKENRYLKHKITELMKGE
jgi:flagellar biosynthesis protein FlhG